MSENPGERKEVWPGRAYPLGAMYDGEGTNFARVPDLPRFLEQRNREILLLVMIETPNGVRSANGPRRPSEAKRRLVWR